MYERPIMPKRRRSSSSMRPHYPPQPDPTHECLHPHVALHLLLACCTPGHLGPLRSLTCAVFTSTVLHLPKNKKYYHCRNQPQYIIHLVEPFIVNAAFSCQRHARDEAISRGKPNVADARRHSQMMSVVKGEGPDWPNSEQRKGGCMN